MPRHLLVDESAELEEELHDLDVPVRGGGMERCLPHTVRFVHRVGPRRALQQSPARVVSTVPVRGILNEGCAKVKDDQK